jgi:fructose-1,6-bisphosphatase/sedoheptulose 1,7-bisphosphatase-like protein
MVPKSLLSSANMFSKSCKLLANDALVHWNVENKKLLQTFGVTILSVEEMEIRQGTKTAGNLETLLSRGITLAAALPALAVALKGRGDLLDVAEDGRKAVKTKYKETADLRASATELEAFYHIVEKNSEIAFIVKVGEGAGDAGRRKPGEALNASLFPGQIIANSRYAGYSVQTLREVGVSVYEIATDPIDGTTNTVMGKQNAITSMLVVDGKIKDVPDVYMGKMTLGPEAARSGLDTRDPLEKVVQGISDSHQVTLGEINIFALDRSRHPIEKLLGLGVNMVLDSDCDLIPGPASSARPGIYDNGHPLLAMFGNTGGAAEYLLAGVTNNWLGGESHGEFVSAKGMEKGGWEGRHDFTEEDLKIIEGAGFKVDVNHPISSLVEHEDGIAAFGGITANAHVPQLSGVFLGNNFAQVDVLLVRASGRLTKKRITFGFEDSIETMVDHFSPVTEVLMNCEIADIRGELRKILEDPGRTERLHREIGLSFYQIFEIKEGKFSLIEEKMAELGDERTAAIVKNLMELKKDWFI